MTWDDFIQSEMKKDYFRNLSSFLAKESKTHRIFPAKDEMFAAFNFCPLDKVKTVILGMDPYYSTYNNHAIAHGLAFSVLPDVPIPPSLRNIYKELKNDLDIEPAKHGCLIKWAEQGILLLNSVLTVRIGEAGSHKNRGWETFTDNAIKLINEQDRPIVVILWGAYAKSKKPLLTNKQFLILDGTHPSPLGANNGGFFGGKYFSKTNGFLIKNGIEPIDWKI